MKNEMKKKLNNKIARRLIVYFTSILLIFTLVVGAAFVYFFMKINANSKKENLKNRAIKISRILAENYDRIEAFDRVIVPRSIIDLPDGKIHQGNFNCSGDGGVNEYNNQVRKNYLKDENEDKALFMLVRLFNSRSSDSVWLIDENKNVIQPPSLENKKAVFIAFQELPTISQQVVNEAFEGKVKIGEDFSTLLKTPTLTAAAPVILDNGKIKGVILIHSPLVGFDMVTWNVIKLFVVCAVVGFLLVLILSVLLSWRFTKPLNLMTENAEKMSFGDYTVRSNVTQDDEIGTLGKALDILGEKLEVAEQESKKLEQLRRDFIANISHELRTPVTVIRASLEALVDKVVDDPKDVERYNQKMLSETLFLQRLINDLLDLSRLQNSNFKIEFETLNFIEIIDDVVYASRRIGETKSVNIDLLFEKEKYNPFLIKGDYGRLRQMLMIFCDNAIKFSTPESKIELMFDGQKLKIRDFGAGIKQEDLPHIFEKFYKSRVEKNKSGTGLGLAISREIAERHGLNVTMESELGNGTTVIIEGFKRLLEDDEV